jgi:hypothetical protein
LIAETTLTREQTALKLWCDKRNVLVDFTGDKIAIVYLRMVRRYRIGAIEYILRGNRWYPHATDADEVECATFNEGIKSHEQKGNRSCSQ